MNRFPKTSKNPAALTEGAHRADLNLVSENRSGLPLLR